MLVISPKSFPNSFLGFWVLRALHKFCLSIVWAVSMFCYHVLRHLKERHLFNTSADISFITRPNRREGKSFITNTIPVELCHSWMYFVFWLLWWCVPGCRNLASLLPPLDLLDSWTPSCWIHTLSQLSCSGRSPPSCQFLKFTCEWHVKQKLLLCQCI